MASKQNKKKNTRIINRLLKVLLVVMVLAVITFGINIFRISTKGTNDDGAIDSAKNEFTNEYYTIGNNATELNKTYFKELTNAVKSKNDSEIASSLVKCFVTEYYTWTNKDGNYDIGGIQYIFSDRQSDFASYTRNDYYADMDLYISQFGNKNLMEVTNVEITNVTSVEDMTVLNSSNEEVSYPCVEVSAEWTYGSSSMDLSETQKSATFSVIKHDGRMEIASIQ